MIILYSGIPGSGKSYKMVKDLIDERNKYYVVHNIDGLKQETLGDYGLNWIEYCEREKMEVTEFFSKEYQTKFSEAVRTKYERDCLVIIDESHEWFDKNKRELKMWLSYHRHLSQTIWLVAHRSTNLSSIYRSFIEVEYRAKSSSIIALPGFFLYARIVGGQQVGYKFERLDKKVFSYYKSQSTGYKKQPKSKLFPVVLLLVIGVVSLFVAAPKYILGDNKKEITDNKEKSTYDNIQKTDKYIYVGRIGDQHLITIIDTGQTVKLKQLPNLICLGSTEDELHLYDVKTGEKIVVGSVPYVKRSPATTEPGKSEPNNN